MRAHTLSLRGAFGRPAAAALLAAACALLALLAWASPARAATTFTVDRSDDPDPTTAQACTAASNDCSLRGAIVAANALAGFDAIDFSVSTVTLSIPGTAEGLAATGDLDITQSVNINGGGGVDINSVSGFDDRVFDVFSPAGLAITGVTVRGGRPNLPGAQAGGILNRSGAHLALTDSTVSGNSASSTSSGFSPLGGGIANMGTLTLTRSTVSGNTLSSTTAIAGTIAAGGGIYNSGTLTLTDSTVSGNTATNPSSSTNNSAYGGGIYNGSGTLTLTNSTVSGNSASSTNNSAYGGGIMNTTANVTLTNSTVSGNSASSTNSDARGGGLYTQNVATLLNTIVANNGAATQGPDVAGPFTGGNNLIEDPSGSGGSGSYISGVDPLLGPLQNNGGPTKTHALLAESPAIDAGSNSGCPGADQRGETRPKDGDGNGTATCDIGAFEKETAPPDATAPTVIGTTPTAGATGVPRNTSPTATFSEQMDQNTLTSSTVKLYKKKKGKWRPVTDTAVSCNSPCTKVTLDPYPTAGTNLAANKRYRVTITTGARDDANNALAQSFTWGFTTGSS